MLGDTFCGDSKSKMYPNFPCSCITSIAFWKSKLESFCWICLHNIRKRERKIARIRPRWNLLPLIPYNIIAVIQQVLFARSNVLRNSWQSIDFQTISDRVGVGCWFQLPIFIYFIQSQHFLLTLIIPWISILWTNTRIFLYYLTISSVY